MDKIKELGQVFTQSNEVDLMIALIKNGKDILEPSCGPGNFSEKLSNCVSIEFDPDICPKYALNIDFFDYPITNKHDSIIGNPPYVAYKNIVASTRETIENMYFSSKQQDYDKRTNLHVFFIDKCIKHLKTNGEIIFVTPREFIKQTSSRHLINTMHKIGTMTHFYDYGDKMLFKGFTPNCAIWRFEKDNFSHKTKLLDGSVVKQQNINGQFVFSNNIYDYDFSDLFDVKVGGVSGMDSVFVHPNGNKEFVFSKTATTGKTRRMYYNHKDKYILSHEAALRKRKIKTFDDTNWWCWGRDYYKSSNKRIYVNCKTRNKKPFFTHSCNDYDGSVLALFIKDSRIDINKCVNTLNNLNWSELGFMVGNRYCFSQSALQNIKIPSTEVNKFLTNLNKRDTL